MATSNTIGNTLTTAIPTDGTSIPIFIKATIFLSAILPSSLKISHTWAIEYPKSGMDITPWHSNGISIR